MQKFKQNLNGDDDDYCESKRADHFHKQAITTLGRKDKVTCRRREEATIYIGRAI